MEGLQKALVHLRAHYKSHGGPSYAQIADSAGASESTIQRYLSDDVVKRPNYTTIVSIASALGMTTADLSLNKDIVDGMEKEQLANLVLELRRINIDELAATREADDERWRERLRADQEKYLSRIELLNKQHADEMARLKDAHTDEIRRCNESHQAHVSQIHEMYAKQFSTMLEGHTRQLESVQRVDQAQRDTVQSMAETQKAADEKSKEFLKARIVNLDNRSKIKDRIIFSLIACIVLLFVADFFLPSMGWIRRITQTMFSHHYFG